MELLTKASFSAEPNQRELENLEVAYRAACEAVVLLIFGSVLYTTIKKRRLDTRLFS